MKKAGISKTFRILSIFHLFRYCKEGFLPRDNLSPRQARILFKHFYSAHDHNHNEKHRLENLLQLFLIDPFKKNRTDESPANCTDSQKSYNSPVDTSDSKMRDKTGNGYAKQHKDRSPHRFERLTSKYHKPCDNRAAATEANKPRHDSAEQAKTDGFNSIGFFISLICLPNIAYKAVPQLIH